MWFLFATSRVGDDADGNTLCPAVAHFASQPFRAPLAATDAGLMFSVSFV